MRALFLWGIFLAGVVTVLVTGYFLLKDWALLNMYYSAFDSAAARGADLRTLFAANARQDVYRINCFAEGVGVLLGAILAAIGIHGLCLLPANPPLKGPSRDD